MEEKPIIVERTGNARYIASSEFRVTYPDGYVGILWSPPWHEWDEATEEHEAMEHAKRLWGSGSYRELTPPPA